MRFLEQHIHTNSDFMSGCTSNQSVTMCPVCASQVSPLQRSHRVRDSVSRKTNPNYFLKGCVYLQNPQY